MPLIISAACALAVLLLAFVLAGIEAQIFSEIVPALRDYKLPGIPEQVIPLNQASPIQALWDFVLLSACTYAGIECARKNNPPELYVAGFVLYLASCLLQIVGFAILKISGMPIACLIAIAAGMAYGRFVKVSARKDKLLDTQKYELLLRNKEIADTQLELVRQNEVERRLLAADLHDQVLNDMKKIVEAFKSYQKEPTKEAANQILSGFAKSMTDIREIMDDLCPVILQNFGLRAAVEDCLEKGKERSGFDTSFECTFEDDWLERIRDTDQALLYRLCQESLTNISKHAAATKVVVRMDRDDSLLKITIEDDGKGIDYDKISHQSRGVRYMKLRADLIGGIVEWHPGAGGKGTRVTIKFPTELV